MIYYYSLYYIHMNLAQEKKLVEEVFNNAIDCLSDEDKALPQVRIFCLLEM